MNFVQDFKSEIKMGCEGEGMTGGQQGGGAVETKTVCQIANEVNYKKATISVTH